MVFFASHPPSQERVQNNQRKAAELPSGGELGRERYQRRIAYIKSKQDAYDAYDRGLAAVSAGNYQEADRLARQAIQLEPREARFYSLRGDVAAERNDLKQAERFYNQAVQRNSNWFYIPLQRGVIRQRMNKTNAARADFEASLSLLPTGIGYYQLGLLEKGVGNRDAAVRHFQVAAQAGGEIGQQAQSELQQMAIR